MNTKYMVIGFGRTETGFFNQKAFAGSIGYACGFYNGHLQDPEMDGAVLIRINHEDWEVIQEFNREHYPISIEYSALATFSVKQSPDLVMV
jgi:hypothetical protein